MALPRQICCGPFTNLTENFLISLYFLNRPAGGLRMRLTVPHFDGRVRVTKNLRLFELARVLVRFNHVASFIINALTII
jgi:hypothetical protein